MGFAWFIPFFISLFVVMPFCLWILRKGDVIYRLSGWLADWFPLFVNRVGLWFLLAIIFIAPALLLGSALAFWSVNRFLPESLSLITVASWTLLRGVLLLPPTVFIIGITFLKIRLNHRTPRYKSNIISAFLAFSIYSIIEIIIITSFLATYNVTLNDIQATQDALIVAAILNIPWLIVWWYLPDPVTQEGVLYG